MPDRTIEGDPAQDLWLRWRRGERPPVREFLAGLEDLSPTQLAAVLRVDQRERWAIGERVPASAYLREFPELEDDPELALEQVYGEFLLREESGEMPTLEEYQREYPRYAARLAMQLDLHRALEGLTEQGSASDAGASEIPPLSQADGAALEDTAIPEPAEYEILGQVGRGGMGHVYKARDTRLGRLVALKFLPPGAARDRRPLARFRREARAASALNHPAICTLHGLGEYQGQPFLVLEWIEGQTLRALAGPDPDLARLLPLFRQVAEALRVAHAAGIVHRDIKPENLMVRPDGYVKVLDFGLARLLPAPAGSGTVPEGVTDPGTLLGTTSYMSPEQASTEPMGSATDIFSLGIVMFELVTGRHPFQAQTHFGTLHAIATQPPLSPARLNPEVPEPLEALILQMLEKDPGRRPTAAEVEAALVGLAGRVAGPRAAGVAPLDVRQTVGRGRERAALRAGFESAAAGRGRMLCVTGEPGIGKTTLVEEFLQDLAGGGQVFSSARGRCSERLGGAEAYLPVLEALDSLVRGEAGELAARAMRLLAPTWYAQIAPLAGNGSVEAPSAANRAASQERMKRELLAFVEEVARMRPLVVFLDDVHWADVSTADLLAYLGSRCAGLRLLLVLTYRPSEMLLGEHPFVLAQLELQRHGVCREVPLGFLGPAEVESYLALAFAGHRFPPDFAPLVHARTEGNPLFLVDLLRYLRDRGVIAEGPGGWSLAQAVPDFLGDLPESVRSMIRKKVAQLGEADRRLLSAASVQGYEFDSVVVARVLGWDAADLEERLEVLDRVHGLVRLRREQEFPDGTLTVRYQFVHVLYQNALYAALQPARRAAWSAAVAQALLGHYGEHGAAIAGELALLFETARDPARAIDHLLLAAQNAVRIFAHHEAILLARRGLALLPTLPGAPGRATRELRLQMTLGLQLQVTQGFAAPEAEQAYTRALALCEELHEASAVFPVLWGLWLFHKVRSQLGKAREEAERLLTLAEGAQDPALLLQVRQALAVTSLCLGDPGATREYMEQGIALYDPQRHASHTFLYGQDPGIACMAFGAVAVWLLGHPDWAVRASDEAVRLGREMAQPPSLVLALHFAAMLRQCRREGQAALEYAEAALTIATEHGFSFWQAGGMVLRGWALAEQGAVAEGIEQMRQGLAAWQETGSVTYRTYYLALLAGALGQAGRAGEGLALVAEALTGVEQTGEGLYEAELHRLRGELLLRQAAEEGRALPDAATAGSVPDSDLSAEAEAETCFRRALAVAGRQGARSLELRAAVSLARLLRDRGRTDEVWPLLEETYGRFTEGGDTADLQEARELLHGLV